MTKPCKRCGESDPEEGFQDKQPYCKPCFRAIRRDHYHANKDRIRKLQTKYRQKAKEEFSKTDQKTLQDTKKTCSKCGTEKSLVEFPPQKGYCKECGREMCRSYKKRNKDKISDYNKSYKSERKEEISAYNSKYNRENRETIQKRHTKYLAHKKKTDPQYRMALTMRNRIRSALKQAAAGKTAPMVDHLGCDMDWFVEWFEHLFEDDISFDNHGKVWHIDHIIPCSLFDLTKKEEQARCFHWSNLQPMYGPDNLSKNNNADIEEIITMEQVALSYYEDNEEDGVTWLQYNRTKYA